jgi:hypothetical protein
MKVVFKWAASPTLGWWPEAAISNCYRSLPKDITTTFIGDI